MAKVVPNKENKLEARQLVRLMQPGVKPLEFPDDVGLHQIYVPSDLGGRLIVEVNSRSAGEGLGFVVTGSNGKKARHRGQKGTVKLEFKQGKRGNGVCTISIKAKRGYKLLVHFEEFGFAREKFGSPLIPWNFWFFPFGDDAPEKTAWGSTTLQPLQKYEKATKTSDALVWEQTHHHDASSLGWEGHCHLIAAASIVFKPPRPSGKSWKGVHFSAEELKYFTGEFMGRFGEMDEINFFILQNGPGAPWQGKSPQDDPELFGEPFRKLVDFLRIHMRDRKHAVMMDLRVENGTDHDEVWNHAAYLYRAFYWQWEGTKAEPIEDLSLVAAEVTVYANNDVLSDEAAGFPSTGLPAETVVVDGEEQPLPNESGRNVLMRGMLQFTESGHFDTSATTHRWNSTHRVEVVTTAGKREEKAEFGTLQLPPSTAILINTPSVAPVTCGMGCPPEPNPHIKREHVLELWEFRKKYR